MKQYNHKAVEKKWQEYWRKKKVFQTKEDAKKPKQYILDMFPYPSGAGLHVGHPKGYIATDVFSRMRMMQGYNVLHPMGWDAFGLPAENYAIKNKVHPSVATAKNVKTFKKQLELLGFTYDWSREINTTVPNYYKWTQWAFLQMFKRGLAYESNEPINWCPSCKTGLANEDLEDGKCERCVSVVEKKPLRQWVLKITEYADRLLKDIDKLDKWPEPIREMQRNWIGRSEGATVKFQISNFKFQIEVFTTRPDTLFGATYVVVAPEHEIISNIQYQISNIKEVQEYVAKAKNKSDLERTDLAKEKTGVELKGIKAINPANNEELPIFVADYVLSGYGTGAIMAVPAHDERDFEFAKKYGLEIKTIIEPITGEKHENEEFRQSIVAIVRNPKDGKLLSLNWGNKMGGNLFIGGGVECEEDIVKCAEREIREETGYKSIKFVSQTERVHHHYVAFSKGVNRCIHANGFLFDLINEEREEQKLEENEKNKFQIEWLTNKEAEEKVGDALHHYVFDKLVKGAAYTGNGVLFNSDFINGLEVEKAKEKMIAWLEEKGLGKRQVQYKLRDWVFSRQRYWGEPIPLVRCEKCAGKKPKVLYIHGIYGNDKENWVPWFKKEIEHLGYEVLVPNLPNNVHPSMNGWLDALGKLDIKDNDRLFIVGHSLGCPVACQYVLKRGAKVEKLILIGPTGKSQGEKNWKNLREAGCDEKSINCIKEFNSLNKNLEKVKKLVGKSVIYLSDNDPYIPMSVKKDYKSLGAMVMRFHNYGHFNDAGNIKELPELLEEFYVMRDGWIPIPEKDLPLKLPNVKHYEPSGTGESPLANIEKWVNTKCPVCGGPAKRETNTMPQWAGSCWYYLAYSMLGSQKSKVKSQKYEWRKDRIDYWNPVDIYVGGAEHATRHLIYARFWHKFLYDIGAVSNDEPFTRLQNVGLILAEDGRKMSKRWGNVINPDDVVRDFGADAMRLYEMFMGPFDQPCAWSTQGLVGMRRFLEKVWGLRYKIQDTKNIQYPISNIQSLLHQTIKKVTDDIEAMRFNTAIAALMMLTNEMSKAENLQRTTYNLLLQLLSPFAPHIAEELWHELGNKASIIKSEWPKYDPELAKSDEMTIAVQVNGKLRDTITMPEDASEDVVKSGALKSEKVQKWLEGKEAKKVIYVKNKLVSIVV